MALLGWGGGLIMDYWEGGQQKCRKTKVLRMKFSIVENVPTPWESIFKLFPASQLPYRAKIQKIQQQKKYKKT